MKKAFILFIFLSFIPYINAYENEYFKVDIPNNYKEIKIDNFTYKWEDEKKSNENVIVTISSNKDKQYNIEKYNKMDVNNFKKYMEEKFTNKLKDYNLEIKVSNVQKEKINDFYTISYDAFWPTKDKLSYDVYQKGYSFTTQNYFYIITITSSNKITDTKIVNSFTPLDNPIDTDNSNAQWKKVLCLSIILGTLAYILSTIIKNKQKN